ncbi:small CPxCG-related zinc finger protein [Natronomonas moolapensis 8.8.11]|uniref:Small CPxCG-related zinc finger protein n=1 Tax=Natronomonas moolapensis (strain DSM 18674 / CECT 7526 / JCM 14361 / 8.8.11) TaxID=268739 RepID=M1XRA5_NATM8|nr:small CPxCG-related zinc finger protein [Natronomonas moolapensis 8.8.11]
MSNKTEPLGVCPECETELQSHQTLIEYETTEGDTGRFVDCYSCGEVVKPE